MDRITQWDELKKEIVALVGEVSSILKTEVSRLAEECGQRPNDFVKIEVDDAILDVNQSSVMISNRTYHFPERALSEDWGGRLGDWLVIRAALRGLRSSGAIREMLVGRM